MRISIIKMLLLLVVVSLSSCLKEDESYQETLVWNAANVDYFVSKVNEVDAKGDTVYTKLHSQSVPSLFILYRELEASDIENARTPLYTSRVEALYAGYLYNDTINSFDNGDANGDGIGDPTEFNVNQVIAGWTLALQNMKEGAKWEVIIPQELAYGGAGAGAIPPYSVLRFTIDLLEIVKYETGENPEEEVI